MTVFSPPTTVTPIPRSSTLVDRSEFVKQTTSKNGMAVRTRCKWTRLCAEVAANVSRELTSQGKIPHDVELQKHPEKSLQGRSWLMGDVSAMIHVSHPIFSYPIDLTEQDVKPAKAIVDDMVKEAKECIERSQGLLGGKTKAKL